MLITNNYVKSKIVAKLSSYIELLCVDFTVNTIIIINNNFNHIQQNNNYKSG